MEEMIFVNYAKAKTIVIYGTYNLGLEIDGGAEENRFSSGTAIRFTRNSDSTYSENYSDIFIDSAGTMNWYGGTIFSKRQFSIYGHFNTFSQNAELIGQHNAEFQIRQRSTSTNINGWVTKGYMFALITNATQIKNYKPFAHIGLSILTPSSASPSNTFMTIEDFNSTGDTGRMVSFWYRKWMRLINNLKGTDMLCEGLLSNNKSNLGLVEFTKSIKFTYLDLDTNKLKDVKNYMRDTDNGKRLGANQINNNPDYTLDRVYNKSSNAIGIVDYPSILLGVVWRTQGGRYYEYNNYDYRNPNNNNSDVFKFSSISYLHDIKVQSLALKGTGYLNVDSVLLPDLKISEVDINVARKYKSLENAFKLYDYLKSYIYDNFKGETQTVIGLNGNQVDARNLTFIVDNNETNMVDYDDTTITINVTEFDSGVKTDSITIFNNGSYPTKGTFDCDVYLNSGLDLSNITINGDLHILAGVDSILTFRNVIVNGLVFNDDENHTLSIKGKDGSHLVAGDEGTGNGETSTETSLDIIVKVKDILGNPIEGAIVYISEDFINEIENTLTDENGEVHHGYLGNGLTAHLVIRKIGYQPFSTIIDISQNSTSNVTLSFMPQVTDKFRSDFNISWNTSPRIITIQKPSTECTIQELLDTLCKYQTQHNTMKYNPIVDVSGGENISEGVNVGLTLTLLDAKVKFQDRSTWTECNILGGNLVAVDDNNNKISPIQNSPYVNVVKSLSVAPTTVATLNCNYDEIADAVWSKEL
jgi:hypothetical protein